MLTMLTPTRNMKLKLTEPALETVSPFSGHSTQALEPQVRPPGTDHRRLSYLAPRTLGSEEHKPSMFIVIRAQRGRAQIRSLLCQEGLFFAAPAGFGNQKKQPATM